MCYCGAQLQLAPEGNRWVCPQGHQVYACKQCEAMGKSSPLQWIEQYQRWYCYQCKQYAPGAPASASTREEVLNDFLFSGESLLFWAQDAEIEPKQGWMKGWMKLDGQVPTYTAGMYAGKNVFVLRQRSGQPNESHDYSLRGILILTDKRLLLVVVSPLNHRKSIYCEVLYDVDFTRNVVQALTERNAKLREKYQKLNPLKKFAMGYQVLYDKDIRPAYQIYVLSNAWKEGRYDMIEISSLALKQDLTPPPIKKVTKDNYAVTVYHPWSSAHSIGAVIAQTAAVLTGDVVLNALMAWNFREKREQYNPFLDIAQTKAPSMAKLINDMSMPLPPPPRALDQKKQDEMKEKTADELKEQLEKAKTKEDLEKLEKEIDKQTLLQHQKMRDSLKEMNINLCPKVSETCNTSCTEEQKRLVRNGDKDFLCPYEEKENE